MMRCLSKDQKYLYQQYSELSEEITQFYKLNQDEEVFKEYMWKLISAEGIWGIPIARKYGGYGLSWQDCLVAIDGFLNHYRDKKLLTAFMSQISALYVVSKYGTEAIKKRYLPRLLKGEMATMHISKSVHQLLYDHSFLNTKENQTLYLRNNKILIYVKKNNGDIVFHINEMNGNEVLSIINGLISPIFCKENEFIANKVGLSALYDLINFEKLFYSIFSITFTNKFNIKEINYA